MSAAYGISKLLVLLIILGIGILVAVILLRRRRSAQQEPACGQCGYLVKGLTTFTCPECGSDLREVGIVTTGTRSTLSPRAKAVIWTIALPFVALFLSFLVIVLGPQQYRERSGYRFSPLSGAYATVALNSTGKGPSQAQMKTETLTFQLTPNPNQAKPSHPSDLVIDPTTFGYRYVGQDGRPVESSRGFDAHVILDWMTAAGVNVENPAVQKETGELFAQAQSICSGAGANYAMMSSLTSSGSSSGISVKPPAWVSISLLIFWPLLWLLGLWRILRRKPRSSPAKN